MEKQLKKETGTRWADGSGLETEKAERLSSTETEKAYLNRSKPKYQTTRRADQKERKRPGTMGNGSDQLRTDPPYPRP